MKFFIILASCFSISVGANFNGRIVGGTDAALGEFPFMISLRYSSQGNHDCGGSLISNEWIVTAGHCVINYPQPELHSIQYGVVQRSKTGDTISDLSEIIVHENYKLLELGVENDIALLRLSNPIEFNEYINKIDLPEQDEYTTEHSLATLVGWGLNETYGVVPEILQKVKLFTSNAESCRAKHTGTILDSNICAGVPLGGKGQCSGDSGGPLILDGKQIGIVSWSIKPCAIAPYPGVFTRVSAFRDWIREKTNI